MEIGMLWFDNDKNTDLRSKIDRAATYYRDKYGQAPNLCFIHPNMLPENVNGGQEDDCGIEIRPMNTMLPHHFWIGVDLSPTERNPNNHDEDDCNC